MTTLISRGWWPCSERSEWCSVQGNAEKKHVAIGGWMKARLACWFEYGADAVRLGAVQVITCPAVHHSHARRRKAYECLKLETC
jgi:hypothetical protein